MAKTIHLVANSHIDPVWLWDQYEGIDEVINTFRSACDRLDEYPTLKFTMSSICFLKWTEHFAPDVFDRIKQQVAAGRWEITGGWWIEPDCNLPTASSFHKSHAISRRFLDRHFPDVKIEVGYCPDSFGHPASFPEILSQQGLKYYVFCRPDANEKPDLPLGLFYWEFRGARILCYRLPYFYSQGLTLNISRMEQALSDDAFVASGLACYFFGVGDHGGGPTKREIEYWLGKQASISDRQLRFSSCHEFFHAAEQLPGIPVYEGDLHFHAVGCYAVNRELKHAIRTAERTLDYAERINRIVGRTTDLDPQWESTIFNQFHDIMPGSCAPDSVAQARGELGGVQHAADWQAYEALRQLAAGTPVQCSQGEFRIVNTLDRPVTTPLEVESFLYYRDGAPLRDNLGQLIPMQLMTPSVICANRRWLFVDTIPARSEKAYYFDTESDEATSPPIVAPAYAPAENMTRGTTSVTAAGQVTLQGEPLFAGRLQLGVVADASDTWAHGIRGFGEAVESFSCGDSAVLDGPLASTLVVHGQLGRSLAEITYRCYDTLPYIDITLKIRWQEERSVLKLLFNMPQPIDAVRAQIAQAVITKHAQDAEEPLHGWVTAGPLALLQDGAFAFDWNAKRLRLTLVRSNLYAYHDPCIVDPHGPLRHTDQGEHSFRLRLMRAEGLTDVDLNQRFEEFIEPFRVLRQNG